MGYRLPMNEEEKPMDRAALIREMLGQRQQMGRASAYGNDVGPEDLQLADENSRNASLAQSLSNAVRGFGSFQGKMADNSGADTFKQIGYQGYRDFTAKRADQDRGNKMLMENLDLMELQRQEQAKDSPLSPESKALLQQRIDRLPIKGIDKIRVPEGITQRQIEEDQILSQLAKDMVAKESSIPAVTPYQEKSLQLREEELKASNANRTEQRKLSEEKYAKEQERQTRKDAEGNSTQNLAATFASRLEEAESVFGQLEKEGYDRSSVKGSSLAAMPDFIEGRLPGGEQSLQQEQAERNFVNSTLRRESGAAIAESEFANAEKQYFPRSGDSPKVVAQKKRNRQIVIDGMKREAGPTLQKPVPSQAPIQTPQVAPSEEVREWTP